jgi:voltage-gated potassium channel
VLQFESSSPDAKILTGREAFWYSIVTITTVGYGDYYPVTSGGRITAMFIMLAGIGIIAVLASLLSNLLMGSPSTSEPSTENSLDLEMIEIKNELAAIRQLLENKTAQDEDR